MSNKYKANNNDNNKKKTKKWNKLRAIQYKL